MAAMGRNQKCGCGSGNKVKRCCGQGRGPGETDLARAFLAGLARQAARTLDGWSRAELGRLHSEVLELPTLDSSLQVPLPRLLTPDVARLLDAIEAGDLEAMDDALPAVVARVDTPAARARLAVAVAAVRDEGRISPEVAAMALIEVSTRKLTGLFGSAVMQAAGVAVGDVRTPAGLLVAAAG